MARPILFPLHRQYLRTCDACGYKWKVSRAFVRGFGQKRASNARRSARVGRNMGALAGPQLMMQQAEQLEAEMSSLEALNAAMRTCARCGSPDFSQRPWRRADREGDAPVGE